MIIGHAWQYNLSTFSLYSHYSGGVWGWSVGNKVNNLNRYSALNPSSSIPSGYNPHYTWAPAIKGNGIASFSYSQGDVTNALLAGGKNCSATILGEGSVVNANFAVIVSMLATITAGGTVSNAELAGVLAMAASVIGEGEVSYANLGAIIDMLATIQSEGGVSYADLLGRCFCSAHIYVNEGAASTEQIVDAIWDELTSDHTTTGSMGKALLDAGSAGNPWGSLTAANNDPGTFGELVQETKQKVIGTQGLVLGA